MPQGIGTSALPFSDNVTRKVLQVGSQLANYGYNVLSAHMEMRPFQQKWIVNQTAEFRAVKAPTVAGGILTFSSDELGPPEPRRLDTWNHNKSLYTYPDNFFVSDREEFLGELQSSDYKRMLGQHVEAVLMQHRKRMWFDAVIRELDDSDYGGELTLMKMLDSDVSETGFTAESSKQLLFGLFPGQLVHQVKKIVVHQDIWLRLYSLAMTVNNAGLQVSWVTKDSKERTLYVHGVPVESDDTEDTESSLDDGVYTFKGLKYTVPGDSGAIRYRAIAVLAPLIHHSTFMPSLSWTHERGKTATEYPPKGRPSGWVLDYEMVYLSYLDAPFKNGANRVGMAYMDFADQVGE